MIKLAKPTLSTATVYADCISSTKNPKKKARMAACAPLIIQAEQELDTKVTKGLVYTIAHETLVNGNVSVDELKYVYTGQMVDHANGRVHYDKLILSAPFDLCPLCAHRDVTTLDHYLPKAKYPRLSVVPINLIPACKDCNTGKLMDYPKTPDEETLHPYYDDIDADRWLKMRVLQTNPISVEFYVSRPAGWSDLLFKRVEGHFKSFGLKKLYATQAGRELVGIKKQLIGIYGKRQKQAAVKKFLLDMARSKADVHLNIWQVVFYNGLAEDNWFCNGNFQLIG
ncbi:HNH endonuclease [Mucilaginibacter pedocola]|uniref:HNH domain-containing protein n=1 Tax=Mucilaginibacter pedocola TaxID=1792845 RepID=A0A1S9P6S8_9SPHI|nr:hypothetical protein [Mucilaginibacter pedocola]OOQ56660.1 hypothetical protein BC343_19750 [Mucilaginibacter pedocola]